MSGGPYVLARSCAQPDEAFATLRQLAFAVLALRSAVPGRPEISVVPAMLTRRELPGGAVLALRLLDGSCGGRGAPLGYAFVPNTGHDAAALRALFADLTRIAA